MNKICEELKNCGFFKKYQAKKQLACLGYINTYCKGGKQTECKRKNYKKEHGIAPPDDMMPTGQLLKE